MKHLKKIVKEIMSLPFGWLILFLLIVVILNILFGFSILGFLGRSVISSLGGTYRIPPDATSKSQLKTWVDGMAQNNEPLSWWERFLLYLNSLNPARDGGLIDSVTGGNKN